MCLGVGAANIFGDLLSHLHVQVCSLFCIGDVIQDRVKEGLEFQVSCRVAMEKAPVNSVALHFGCCCYSWGGVTPFWEWAG